MRKTRLAWNNWFEKWKQGQEIKNLMKRFDRFSRVGKNAAPPISLKQAESQKSTQPIVTDDLGKLHRVIFKSGGSLLCYVKARKVDAEGALVSIRIVHSEGAGEETIAAALISRIDDLDH